MVFHICEVNESTMMKLPHMAINTRTQIVGGQGCHKITIYGNGLSVYIHIWQIRDVTNRQLFTRGY